ncbi:MAG: hypothetical protein HOP12_10375 [Candidatus Eisenbacteria bacterium]|uniref:Ammonium transporter n=1 Tax=Eiseniibacteriota bacterium TaxID=2212470 RepID=A0A849SLD8_UNCEI|nr:hypothetical protein [Candidatus Eisenbacteria bacterium]
MRTLEKWNVIGRAIVIAGVLCALVAGDGSSNSACAAAQAATEQRVETLDGPVFDPGADPERRWGVYGAWLCATGAFLLTHGGVVTPANTGVVAATVGGCMLAALDVITTE